MDYDAQRIVDSINKFQAGSVEAFNDIYEGTYRLVYSTCYGIIKDEEDSRDVTQDAFVYMYEKLDTLNNPSAYAKWMKLIASGRALNFVKRKGYTYNVEDDVEMDMALADWEQFDSIPESFIEDEEKKQIINKVLKESLSEVQYQTIFMYYFGEMPLASIAETMNCPEGTVKTRLMHAKARFRESLEGYLDDNKLVLAATPFMTRFFNANAPKVSIPSIAGLGIPGLVGTAGMAGAGAGSSSIGSGLSAAADAGQSAAANTAQVAGANIGQIAAGESSPAAAAEVGQKALGNMGTKSSAKSAQAVQQSPLAVNSPVSDSGVSAAGNTGKIVGARGGFLSTVAGKITIGGLALLCIGTIAAVGVIIAGKDKTEESTSATETTVTSETGVTGGSSSSTDDTAASRANDVALHSEVKFGNFGGEDIEWVVIDKNDDGYMLLSKKSLYSMAYDKDHSRKWESSDLRRWLNNDFYDQAFSMEEKRFIKETVNENPPLGDVPGEDPTSDRVFILRSEESSKIPYEYEYAKPTQYAIDHGIWTSSHGNTAYWLRPAFYTSYESDMPDLNVGGDDENGNPITGDFIGVRPVIWHTYEPTEVPAEVTEIPDTVTFGRYGGEDIEWTVIDENENGKLLLSNKAIDRRNYNDKYGGATTWEKCSLRKWLNNDFYDQAFSSDEKGKILLTKVQNPDNQVYGTEGGKDTEDHIFLLSTDEVKKYLDSDESRKLAPTDYARAQGLDGYCNWYLRTPGQYRNWVALVHGDGKVSDGGYFAFDGNYGVRPAMWVSK